MASIIKVDTIQSTTANVFFQNSSGTEYARFDSNGNLGIGAASPTSITKFYVEQSGGGNVLGYFNSTATAQNARLRINSTDNASSVAYVWSYSHASLNKQASMYLTSTGALAVQAGQTAGSEPTSGTTSAILNQYGIGLGGTNPSSGTGIAFPATQSASSDANTLDDYEEGTWTPSVTGTVSGGPFTFGTSQAYYTKIGREVKLSMFMSHNSTVTFSGAYKIGNFPFTVANYSGGGFVSYIANWISNSPVMLQVEASTTYGYLRMKTSANPEQMFDLNSGLIQNNTAYMLTILYTTTT